LVPTATGINWVANNEFSLVFSSPDFTTLDGEYDYVLPSADFALDVTDSMKVRLSYGESIGRPGWGDIQGGQTLNQLARINGGTGQQGNPGLLPLESQNYDLSFEWYFAESSYVSAGFFEMLGTAPALGRALRAEDDEAGREKVVVLSHGLWQRRFGSDPGVVDRKLILNGQPYTVVGVLGRDFIFPVRDVELALPLSPDQDPWRHDRESTNFIRAIGRAKAGVTGAQIAEDLGAIHRRLQKEFPESYARKPGVLVKPYQAELTRNVGETLWMLLAAVGLLLAIACANLANLTMVRANARRREVAVRRALGAGRMRLVRQLLVESSLLSLGGAALGILLARWAVPALVALSPATMPRAREVDVNLPVLLFTLGAAALTALAFGLVPALRATRGDPGRDLQSEGRGGAGTAEGGRVRGLIVAAQVAVMVVLLTGTGLLLKSFYAVTRVEPGFDAGVLTVRLSLPRTSYGDIEKVGRFYDQVEARVMRLPGVIATAAVNHVPLNGALASADYKVADRPPLRDDQLPTAQYRMVTPAYFRTMGIPLVAGRAFADQDRSGGAPVAIVSQSLARQSFPGRDPVGEHLLVQDTPSGFRSLEVVGVVGDLRHASLEGEAEPHLFVPYHQTHPALLVWLTQNQYLAVRTSGPPLALADAVRRELRAVDPDVAPADVRSTAQYLGRAAEARRFSLVLLALFALVGLALAAVGIYGVVSYSVSERTREVGVRLALGAAQRDILGLVLREGLRHAGAGIAVGMAAAFVATRALSSLLFGVKPTDPFTYAGVVAVLGVVAVAASLLPASQAARSSPLEALRHE
jgi:putative ABC transport system permease protein